MSTYMHPLGSMQHRLYSYLMPDRTQTSAERQQQLRQVLHGCPAGRKKGRAVLMPFQLAVLVGIAITYIVVGGDNLAAFVASVAPNAAGGKWGYYLMFGGLELLLSMVRMPSMAEQLSCMTQAVQATSPTYCRLDSLSACVRAAPSSGRSRNPWGMSKHEHAASAGAEGPPHVDMPRCLPTSCRLTSLAATKL